MADGDVTRLRAMTSADLANARELRKLIEAVADLAEKIVAAPGADSNAARVATDRAVTNLRSLYGVIRWPNPCIT